MTHDAYAIEDSNDKLDKTIAPNGPVADDDEVFNDNTKSKKVTPDRAVTKDKEVLDDNHHKQSYKMMSLFPRTRIKHSLSPLNLSLTTKFEDRKNITIK